MCAVDSRSREAVLLRPFGAQKVASQMSARCRTSSCSDCWGLVLLSRIMPVLRLLLFGVREYLSCYFILQERIVKRLSTINENFNFQIVVILYYIVYRYY